MKLNILFVLVCFNVLLTTDQTQAINRDSLYQVHFETFKDLASNRFQKDSAVYHLKKTLVYARGNRKKECILYNRATAFYIKNKEWLDNALLYSDKACACIKEHPNPPINYIMKVNNHRGHYHLLKNEYLKAIEWLEKNEQYLDDLDANTKLISNYYGYFGMVYGRLGMYSDALTAYDKSYEYQPTKFLKAKINRHIAKLQINQFKAKKELNHTHLLDSAYIKLTAAKDFYTKREERHLLSIIRCDLRLGILHFYKGNLDTAYTLLKRVEKYAKEYLDKEDHILAHRYLSKIYLQQGNLAAAELNAIKSFARAEKVNSLSGQMNSAKHLATVYEIKGDAVQALKYLKIFNLLKKQHKKEEERLTIVENRLKGVSNENSALQVQVFSISTLSGLALLSFIFFYRKRTKRLQQVIYHENEKNELISEALASQQAQTRQLENELQSYIQLLSESRNAETEHQIQGTIEKLCEYRLLTDADWSEFKKLFLKIHTQFFEHLTQTSPQLSATDQKVAALIRLNLDNTEIGTMLAISPESIRKAKYRLRKKLQIDTNQELKNFIFSN